MLFRSYLGHIGYHVDPPFRGHGAALRACRLCVSVLADLGMRTFVITTDEDNLPSILTCERLGCTLECSVDVPLWCRQEFSIISRLGISCKVDQLVTPEMDVVELVRANEAAHGKIACVLCDESQFFTPEQADQLFLVTVDLGIPVICYGLRADFMMRGFPGSTRLLEIAHTIEELKTICACGRKAICNGRKVNGEFVFEGAQVAIDTVDDVEYQSLCPQCWYREYRAFLARHPKK